MKLNHDEPLSNFVFNFNLRRYVQWEQPPISAADWEREFTKYKQSPEFSKTNINMTVDEYKFIYWMEYAHRMWAGLSPHTELSRPFTKNKYNRPISVYRLGEMPIQR